MYGCTLLLCSQKTVQNQYDNCLLYPIHKNHYVQHYLQLKLGWLQPTFLLLKKEEWSSLTIHKDCGKDHRFS